MSVEENLRVIETVDKYVRAGDWDGFDERHSEDVVSYSQFTPEPTKGIVPHREALQRLQATFPDFELHTVRTFGQGEWVAAEYTMTGTHEGPLAVPGGQDIPPTHKSVSIPVSTQVRFVDGKIVEEHIYFDRATMLAQLGVETGSQQ